MKNFTKLFGIAAFVAVIGFTMTACPEKGGDDGGGNGGVGGGIDTYKGCNFIFPESDYVAAFGGSIPTGFNILIGNKADLEAKVMTAIETNSGLESYEGLSLSEVENKLQGWIQEGHITADEKPQVLNSLNSKGYVVAVKRPNGIPNVIGVFAISKE